MNNDPFYRQLVRTMQETGREGLYLYLNCIFVLLVTSTRQSARYKDDLQTARGSSSTNTMKLRAKRRYKVEMPLNASEAKLLTICKVINLWTLRGRLALARGQCQDVSSFSKPTYSRKLSESCTPLEMAVDQEMDIS